MFFHEKHIFMRKKNQNVFVANIIKFVATIFFFFFKFNLVLLLLSWSLGVSVCLIGLLLSFTVVVDSVVAAAICQLKQTQDGK